MFLERVLEFDRSLFIFLNESLAWECLDGFFIVLTSRWFGLLVGGAFSLLIILLYRKEGLFTFILVVIVVVLADRIVCDIIKPLVGRPRPPWVLDEVRLLVGVTQAGSFPSAHAGNHFSIFTVFLLKHRLFGWAYLPVAILISYSRIYVGVHYPLDIIGGAIFGFLLAFSIVLLFNHLRRRLNLRSGTN